MKITVFGMGYVGTVTAAEAIAFGNFVVLYHAEESYVDALGAAHQKEVLDLAGRFKQKRLSDANTSIIVEKRRTEIPGGMDVALPGSGKATTWITEKSGNRRPVRRVPGHVLLDSGAHSRG